MFAKKQALHVAATNQIGRFKYPAFIGYQVSWKFAPALWVRCMIPNFKSLTPELGGTRPGYACIHTGIIGVGIYSEHNGQTLYDEVGGEVLSLDVEVDEFYYAKSHIKVGMRSMNIRKIAISEAENLTRVLRQQLVAGNGFDPTS